MNSETKEENSGAVFAGGCGFYKLVWIFFIGAFAGDLIETVFCRFSMGEWMSRSSVVWGDFSIVWGLAIMLATVILYRIRRRPSWQIFIIGTVLGGLYEYLSSVFTEIVFGKIFWDYSHIPFNIAGRINLLFCFFWGIAAVIWIKHLYPKLSDFIEKIPVTLGKKASVIMIVFMCVNMAVSGLALIRQMQRYDGIPAEQSWQVFMDEHFDDERLNKIYPAAKDVS